VIGLLGGVASGKSWVAKYLAQLGAVVLDADRVGHQVLEEPEVKQALRQRWGEEIFAADGQIDRAAVGRKVFAPPAEGPNELRFLEQIVHPRIGQRLSEQIAAARAAGAPAIVLDAAVMLKAGWDEKCDVIWFVDAPRALRIERARQRGWDEKQFAAREAAQESVEEKRGRADAVIENAGPKEDTQRQLRGLWKELVES
jgi:dephospho-CoA kinase